MKITDQFDKAWSGNSAAHTFEIKKKKQLEHTAIRCVELECDARTKV